jgi:DNA-binding winged helix-turn-helix (wHTH) protein/alpha-beta hydrolase superfamily lysophospholipase
VWHIERVVLALGEGLELDTLLFELRRGDQRVPMEPQAFDVLVYLVSHRDRVVPKDELMDAVWGNRFVSEAAVTSRIKQARKALGDDGQAQRLIRTVHGRGYRFVAPVDVRQAPETERPALPAQRRDPSGALAPIRYTVSDDLHIAYQVTGGGDLDIVLISGFVSHLELDWADPRHAHFLDRLGSMGRLIRFDKRGTGMSDRPPGVPDLETRMHDVLAVMQAANSERALLCGYSEGGAMAILLAATHPERVRSLVLYGCYAKATWAPDYPWARTQDARREYTDWLVNSWDWEADCVRRCPSADPDMQRWWTQRMRAAATPSTIRALMDMNSLVDVRDALPSVRVPTLVLHRIGDGMFPVADARYIADHIAGAHLQVLEGNDHFCAGDPDQILDAVEAFASGQRTQTEPALVLAVVVAIAGDDGDALAAQLARAGGRLRHDPAGRAVLLFDGPATAVRAGLAHLRGDARLGLTVAEVVRDADEVAGYAVEVAAQLADAAPPGAVWVSDTVGVLLSGSTVVLEPGGTIGGGVSVQRAVSA